MKYFMGGTSRLLSAGDEADGGFWGWVLASITLVAGYIAMLVAAWGLIYPSYEQGPLSFLVRDGPSYARSVALLVTAFTFAFYGALLPIIALSLSLLNLSIAKVVAPGDNAAWRLVAKIAILVFLFMTLVALLRTWIYARPQDVAFSPLPFWAFPYLPATMLFIAFQATTEELFYRGFLLQLIGRWTKSWPIILLSITALFLIHHLANPEIDVFGWKAYLDYISAGLLFTGVALATGRLEYSIGLHIGWNWSLLMFDIRSANAHDLYRGLGAIVYTGDLTPTIVDAISSLLLYIVLFLMCLLIHFRYVDSTRSNERG